MDQQLSTQTQPLQSTPGQKKIALVFYILSAIVAIPIVYALVSSYSPNFKFLYLISLLAFFLFLALFYKKSQVFSRKKFILFLALLVLFYTSSVAIGRLSLDTEYYFFDSTIKNEWYGLVGYYLYGIFLGTSAGSLILLITLIFTRFRRVKVGELVALSLAFGILLFVGFIGGGESLVTLLKHAQIQISSRNIEKTTFNGQYPTITFMTNNEVYKAYWDGADYSYKKFFSYQNKEDKKPQASHGARSLLQIGNTTYVGYGSGINAISSDGLLLGSWERPLLEQEIKTAFRSGLVLDGSSTISGFATDGEYIYLSANGSLFVLDKDLKQVADLKLNIRKNGDDFIVLEDSLLILDNVYSPFYILTIDISDPTNPKITNAFGHSTVNGGLSGQWLDKDGNWYVDWKKQTAYGRAYGEEIVSKFPSTRYTEPKGANQVDYSDTAAFGQETKINTYGDNGKDSGYSILGDLDMLGDYMVIAYESHDDIKLAKLDANLNVDVTYSMIEKKNFPAARGVSIVREGVFVAVNYGNQILLFEDSAGSPKQIATFSLPSVEENIYSTKLTK